MKKAHLALFAATVFGAACSESNFSSQSQKIAPATKSNATTGSTTGGGKTGSPTGGTGNTSNGNPGKGTTGGTGGTGNTLGGTGGTGNTMGSTGETSTGASTGGTGTTTLGGTATAGGTTDPVPVVIDQTISVFKDCTVNLGYNPAEVQCNINVASDSVWANVDGWRDALGRFTDKSASWISPLPASTDNDGHPMCALLDGTEKLLYVSYIKVAAAGAYNFEAIMDDQGQVRMWKRSDPNQEVYATPSPLPEVKGSVNLEAAGYAVVVEAQDTNKAATAMTFSLKDGGGNVTKRSLADGSWCIFRVPASTNAKSFLPTAAGCRVCFGGTQP